jgi:hypothetical protein
MIGFAEITLLFHSLTGMCAGWMFGSRHGVISGLALGLAGTLIGMAAGFLIARMPKAIRLVSMRIPGKYRVLATLYTVFTFGFGVAFWSAFIHCVEL